MEYFSEYGVDIDAMQAADNEAYMNRNRALRVVTESVDAADVQSSDNLKVDKDVGKQVGKKIGIMKPIPVDELMLSWEPTEWIVDLFGAKGALNIGVIKVLENHFIMEWRPSRMKNHL